jgi:hypothetical protein
MDRLEVYPSTRLAGVVYRAVAQVPPSADDFKSYADLGRTVPSAHYLRLTAVSMYQTLEDLERACRRYGLPEATVALDLRRDPRVTYALTNPRTGHLAVWGPPEALLACVF